MWVASGEFRADQLALWLANLGLGLEFMETFAPHAEFLRAEKRRDALKKLLESDDTTRQMQRKMVALCAGSEARLDEILEALLAELAAEKDDKIRLIERCALDGLLWKEVEERYGYRVDEADASPSVRDFAIDLFGSCYAMELGEEPTAATGRVGTRLTADALVLLKRWKESVRYQEAFGALSADCAHILNIEADLNGRDYRTLVDVDFFELIDRKILHDLAAEIANRTIFTGDVEQIVSRRKERHWYDRYQHIYSVLDTAARFLHKLDTVTLEMQSLVSGIQQYSQTWYKLDQLYRRFVFHARQSNQPTLLTSLLEQIENQYTNNYVLTLNDRWQQWVDVSTAWEAAPILHQRDFFETCVRKGFLDKNNKVFVVISDALRYEVGEELLRSMAFVGNTQHTVPYMLRHSDLFDDLPPQYHDSAFLDRLHFYIPGWEVDIIRGEMFSEGYGFVVDYLAEILRNLRNHDYAQLYAEHFELNAHVSTRDRTGIEKTFSGVMKILFPQRDATVDEIEELVRFAVEGRKRVKDQWTRIDLTYSEVNFGYTNRTGKQIPVQTLEQTLYPRHYNGGSALPEQGALLDEVDHEVPKAETLGQNGGEPELGERHITFQENQRGVTFDELFGPYLAVGRVGSSSLIRTSGNSTRHAI